MYMAETPEGMQAQQQCKVQELCLAAMADPGKQSKGVLVELIDLAVLGALLSATDPQLAVPDCELKRLGKGG